MFRENHIPKQPKRKSVAVLLLVGVGALVALADNLGTAFTYQGQLNLDGTPVNTTVNMRFEVYDDPNSVTPLASYPPVGTIAVLVMDGLFTEEIDFGQDVFTGQARWLQVYVNDTPLSPRQKLTPAPYALALPGLFTQQTTGIPNLVGGYAGNVVGANVQGAMIAGGGSVGQENRIYDDYGAIGGGRDNSVGVNDDSRSNQGFATVAGGAHNVASGEGSFVGGGMWNRAAGWRGAVLGGENNQNWGWLGTIAAGRDNLIEGGMVGCNLIGGRGARTNHLGTFVWADMSVTDPNTYFASTDNNQFLVRAVGGVGINTDSPAPNSLTVNGVVHSLTGGFKLPDGTVLDDAGDLGGGGGGWGLTGNAGTDPATNFLGTTDNAALELRVNNQRALRLEPNATAPNVIAGDAANAAGANVVGASIGGGGTIELNTLVCDGGPNEGLPCGNCSSTGEPCSTEACCDYDEYGNCIGTCDADNSQCPDAACVNGRSPGNRVFDSFGTIAGGANNVAGTDDSLPANSSHATVGGGMTNVASGAYSTVGGGRNNTASGQSSTVPGGWLNQAGGDYSFAGGKQATVAASHSGTFVWSGSSSALPSTGAHQFLIGASGGVGINTNNPAGYALNVNGAVNANNLLINGVPVGGGGGGIGGGGTANHIAKFTGPTAIGDSALYESGGNVGIGTSDPTSKLHVQGGAITVANQGDQADVLWLSTERSWVFRQQGTGAGTALKLQSIGGGGDKDFIIDTTGNVGIGTTTPEARLDVNGAIVNTAAGDGTILFADTNESGTPTSDGFRMRYENNFAGIGDALIFEKTDGNGVDPDGGIAFVNTGNDGVVETLLFLDGNGRVGIGDSTPAAKLEVRSDSTPTTPQLRLTEAADDYARITFGTTENERYWTIAGIEHQSDPGFDDDQFVISHSAGGNVVSMQNWGQTGAQVLVNGVVGINRVNPDPTAALDVNGTTKTSVLEITGADLAERFPISDKVEPGMVVEIDPENAGQLRLASGAYNRRVAGVVSGAGGLSAGAILGNLPESKDAPPIAMSGRVWVYCDATTDAIQPGDLLTTADSAGHAMKVTDYPRAQGAIIGKAMTALKQGTKELVLVLVSLQ